MFKALLFIVLVCWTNLADCEEPFSIIASWTKRISKTNINRTTETLIAGLHHAVALDVNSHTQELFWSDGITHKIYRISLKDDFHIETVVVEDISTVDGLAVDWIHNKLYWTDTGVNTIEVMDLETNMRAVLVNKHLAEPRGIALEPSEHKMFWTDWGTKAKIECADLDGTYRNVLVDTNLVWPNGIVLDFEQKKLYWVDGSLEKIESSNYDGSDRKLIGSTSNQVFGITIYGSYLYYSDWGSRSVKQASKSSLSNVKMVESSKSFISERPMGLQVFHTDRQPIVESDDRCKKLKPCSQMCINNHISYSCFCQIGYTPSSDGRFCREKGFLIAAWRDSIQTYDIEEGKKQVIRKERSSIVGLDIHYSKRLVFWSNIDSNIIYRGKVSNSTITEAEVLVEDVGTVDGLAVDWVCNNLYWTDTERNTIEVLSLDTKSRKVLFDEFLEEPRAIIVYPPQQMMFFSDWGATPKIESASLDGSERKVLIKTGLKWPNGLAIDWKIKRLFWVDGDINTLSSCDFDGSNRKSELKISTMHQAFGITLNDESIFYSEWKNEAIYKINRRNLSDIEKFASGLTDPMSLKLHTDTAQPDSINPCEHSNCSHLCLPTTGGGSVCACPSKHTLSVDRRTCSSADVTEDTNAIKITDLKIDKIGKTDVSLTWTVNKNFLVHLVMFDCLEMWRCGNDCDENTNFEKLIMSNRIEENTLKPGAQYNVTIFITHQATTSTIIRTEDENNKTPVFLRDVEVSSGKSATAKWQSVTDCQSVLYFYHVINTKDQIVVSEGLTSSPSLLMNDLSANTEYELRVWSKINDMKSTDYLSLKFKTRAVITDSEMKDVTVYKHTRKEIGLRWHLDKQLQSANQTYKLMYNEADAEVKYIDITQEHCVPWPEMYCYTLTDLKPKRSYFISIAPVFPDKLGGFVNVTATTKEAVPDIPSYLNITSLTLTGMGLQWGIPSLINGHLRTFLVNLEEVDKFLETYCCQEFPVMEINVQTESPYYETEIAGLQPASSYAISVSAKTIYFGPSQKLVVNTRPPPMKVLYMPNITGADVSWSSHSQPELWPDSKDYHPLITGYILLAVGSDTTPTDSGFTDVELKTEVVNNLGPKAFLVAQYYENGNFIDVTSDREVECKWGEARTSFVKGEKYKFVAVQVSQYINAYRLDVVMSDEVIVRK